MKYAGISGYPSEEFRAGFQSKYFRPKKLLKRFNRLGSYLIINYSEPEVDKGVKAG
jgi:hypothetical protein